MDNAHYSASVMFYSRYDFDDYRWRKARFVASSDTEALGALRRLVTRWNADKPNDFHIVRECDLARLVLGEVDGNGNTADQDPAPFYRFRISTIVPRQSEEWEVPPESDAEFAKHLAAAVSGLSVS